MLGPVVFRPLADSAGVSAVRSAFVVLNLRERMPVSLPSPASQASVHGSALRQLPGRYAEVATLGPDSDAVEIGGPPPAAPADAVVAAGPPPAAAGEEGQDEELV